MTLTDWDNEQGSPVIEAERVEVYLSALSTLSGNVDFSDAHFIRPTLRLKRLADGRLDMTHSNSGRLSRAIERGRATVTSNPEELNLSALQADEFGAVEFIDGSVVAVSEEGEDKLLSSLTGNASLPALNKARKLVASGIWYGEHVALELSSSLPLIFFCRRHGADCRLAQIATP